MKFLTMYLLITGKKDQKTPKYIIKAPKLAPDSLSKKRAANLG